MRARMVKPPSINHQNMCVVERGNGEYYANEKNLFPRTINDFKRRTKTAITIILYYHKVSRTPKMNGRSY